MSNVIRALINILNCRNAFVAEANNGTNRMNARGVSLEHFVRDAFAGTFGYNSSQRWANTCFSYIGGGNTPPDIILAGSDAIEVKKDNGIGALQLNSTFPKAHLLRTNPKISNAAKNCDGGNWISKDMLYVIGTEPQPLAGPKTLWMIYGDCFCADPNIFEALETSVKNAVQAIPGYNWAVTNELAKAVDVDPLATVSMRVRAMWMLKHPHYLFQDLVEKCINDNGTKYADPEIFRYRPDADSQIYILMRAGKFNSLPSGDIQALTGIMGNNLLVEDVDVADPDNPAVTIKCKLICYSK